MIQSYHFQRREIHERLCFADKPQLIYMIHMQIMGFSKYSSRLHFDRNEESMKKRKDKDLAYIDHYRYRQLLYFCFQYNTWKQEIEEMNKNLKPDGMHYDGMPKARSISSETERKAIRLVVLQKKIDAVDRAAKTASPDLAKYIIYYCANRDINFEYLRSRMKIPCSESTFFRHRAVFFRVLSSILDEYCL